jgi:GDP-L-fucose synthase
MSKEKILVTGGSGLVGSAINNISERYNYDFLFVSSSDCDLTDFDKTLSLFKSYNPDYVIHLAAKVGGLFKNMNEKVQMYEVNTLININVLRCCNIINVKKCISCLSTCIFPDKTTYPINEEMLHNGAPHKSNDCYAYAKRMLEVQSRAYNEQFGNNFVCIIPTNIYGPHDNFNLNDAHVIPALIHKCYLAKKNGEDFVVMGSGAPLRQFIYSEDLAILIMFVMEKYEKKDSIILSVGEEDEVSIKNIATLIAKSYEYESRMVFDITKSDGQYKKTADNSKLIKLLQYDFKNIEQGIRETICWFNENYDICRK